MRQGWLYAQDPAAPDVRQPYPLRVPCRHCGSDQGSVRRTGTHDVVRCLHCHRWAYNARRVEVARVWGRAA